MTPAELRERIAALGLSQVKAAMMVPIDPRTMRRYLAGDCPVPGWMVRVMRDIEREMMEG